MKLHCAILDDYQHVAMEMADWSTVKEQVDVQSFSQHFEKEEELLKAINHCEIIVIMRERTPLQHHFLKSYPS